MYFRIERFIEYCVVTTDMADDPLGENLFRTEVRAGRAVLREVGQEILFPHYLRAMGVDKKPNGSWCCDQDFRSSDRLLGWRRDNFPDDGVIEEESFSKEGWKDDRETHSRVQTIDPLDSSFKFIFGNREIYEAFIEDRLSYPPDLENIDPRTLEDPTYAIIWSLMVDCVPQVGMTYLPHYDKLVWGVVGYGAFVEERGKPPVPIRVSADEDIRIVTSGRRGSDELKRLLKNLHPRETRAMGGSAKFLEVALGTATLAAHPPENETMVWDQAANYAIIKAAGGDLTDRNGDPLDFSAGSISFNNGVLAFNCAAVRDQFLEKQREIYG